MRILDVCEVTKPIASPIRNAYIDFSQMTAEPSGGDNRCHPRGSTASSATVSTPMGAMARGGLIREQFRARILEAEPKPFCNE